MIPGTEKRSKSGGPAGEDSLAMRRKAKGGAGRGTPAPGSTASLLGETCLPATVRLLAGVFGCQQCCPHIDTWRNKSMALWKAADDQQRMAKLLRQYRIRARDLNRAAYHSIGVSPLHAVARAGNSDCVRLLLAHGAHVDVPGPDSDSFETPLMTTFSSEGQSWSAQHAVALALLDAGADSCAAPVLPSGPGFPAPLVMAARRGNLEVMQLLIDAKASLSAAPTAAELFPISEAVRFSRGTALQLLLKAGADVHFQPGTDQYFRPILVLCDS